MKIKADVNIVTIEPNLAKELLDKKIEQQRPIKNSHVKKLINDMKSGQFKLSSDAILIINGKLANGQHRLMAVYIANTPQQFLLMESNDEELYKVLDCGAKRTEGDVLVGIKYAGILPAMAKWMNVYEKDALSPGLYAPSAVCTLSRSEVIEFCKVNQETMVESAEFISPLYSKTKLLPITISGAILATAMKNSPNIVDDVKAFFEQVYLGSGYERIRGQAALDLRNKLIQEAGSRSKYPSGYIFAIVIKCLHGFLKNYSIKSIRFSEGEKLPKI